VVVGPNATTVSEYVAKAAPKATTHIQNERLGTAHAVLAAEAAIAEGADDVVVLYGDTPLVRAATIEKIRAKLAEGADQVVVGFESDDPTGYGRLITDTHGRLTEIVEEKDATDAQRAIKVGNAGLMGFRGEKLLATLKKIGKANAKGEYYLTDAVGIVNAAGGKAVTVVIAEDEVIGVNSREQLAHAEGLFQRRARLTAMTGGATLIAPSTVWFSHDTVIGRDVTIEPNVFFAPGVTIADDVTIRANSHIEGATVASGAVIGPFARLRPGAAIGENAHIGNFVEVKNATIGEGVKANHLTYIGDAAVGPGSNIGAGTITCNYDGFEKHKTTIGADVFIGSNSALVAPVTIGDRANVAAGSVITRDVAPDALAVARGQQADKPGWAKKYRDRLRAAKAAKSKTR
jgi:bifunctional UDP-N-acetylglucosamine pyrophosphorylase/glucosamine-1-phosphate N-acetyltransferase